VAPSIKITGHKHQSVRTVANTIEANGVTVTDHEEMLIERVWATFTIEGALPFSKTQRSRNEIQPVRLVACYQSNNGDPWKRGSSDISVEGYNIKKGGGQGADATVQYYDLPDSLKELFAPTAKAYYRDGGPVFEWINAEYPR
jgi:hypothetical protein